MIVFEAKRLQALFKAFSGRKIIVAGDVMLDRYLWGQISRISPEAPVPVVDIASETCRVGGAANVTYNVHSLGASVIPVGVIGDDASGVKLKELFREKGFPTEGLIVDGARPTTVKTRIIAHNQHVVRTDREIRDGISTSVQNDLMTVIKAHIEDADGIILEDYNKGLFVPPFIQNVIQSARDNDKLTFVDPKFDNFFDFQDVTLFKPNRKEAADKLGIRLDDDEALSKAGSSLLEQLKCQAVLITLGGEGMALFEPGKAWQKVGTRAVQVHDVSGAGDTVIAAMAVAMTSGAALKEAATLANHAAGLACGEVGIVPINTEKLLQDIMDDIGA